MTTGEKQSGKGFDEDTQIVSTRLDLVDSELRPFFYRFKGIYFHATHGVEANEDLAEKVGQFLMGLGKENIRDSDTEKLAKGIKEFTTRCTFTDDMGHIQHGITFVQGTSSNTARIRQNVFYFDTIKEPTQLVKIFNNSFPPLVQSHNGSEEPTITPDIVTEPPDTLRPKIIDPSEQLSEHTAVPDERTLIVKIDQRRKTTRRAVLIGASITAVVAAAAGTGVLIGKMTKKADRENPIQIITTSQQRTAQALDGGTLDAETIEPQP